MIYSAIAISNYFLKRSFDEGNTITQMKLIKLVYFAHAWNLAFKDNILVDEVVEAWKYGPVFRSIYLEFKEFGSNPINRLGSQIINSEEGYKIITPYVAEKADISFLEAIWNHYKQYDGYALSAIEHRPGTPWTLTYNANEVKNIPNDSIKNHYKSLLIKDKEVTHV